MELVFVGHLAGMWPIPQAALVPNKAHPFISLLRKFLSACGSVPRVAQKAKGCHKSTALKQTILEIGFMSSLLAGHTMSAMTQAIKSL